jgi:glyoxylase-like metal-dependent hydrolase (beta-lactamase superfamily II)
MLGVDQIAGSGKLSDEYVKKNLGVKYTPGHTPGHILLYLESPRIVFGADVLWNMEENCLVLLFHLISQ